MRRNENRMGGGSGGKCCSLPFTLDNGFDGTFLGFNSLRWLGCCFIVNVLFLDELGGENSEH